MKTVQLGLIVSFLTGIALAGLVKRDTVEETIGQGLDDLDKDLDNKKNEMVDLIEQLKGKTCLADDQCLEPLQFCNKEVGFSMEKGISVDIPHCVYHIWVYIALAAVLVLFLLLVCVCCACLPCCCCYSLCRKK